ncbi:MAG: hypothetical protein KDB01_19390 [Planctomycetaceae bacterium]|nr:hypothetical protein [Planctomycetaceae bacterium]
MSDIKRLPPTTAWDRRAMLATLAAVLGCAVAWTLSPQSFFKVWLAAAMFPWSISIGSLALMLIVCLTGGRWGQAAWPWLRINARLMPLVALMFVPFLCGARKIYPWANSDILLQVENTENRQWLFQMPFYIGRTLLYFAVWIVLSWLVGGRRMKTSPSAGGRILTNSATSEAATGDAVAENPATDHLIMGGPPVAGLGLIAILLTVTCAGIDWVMSLDPFFVSTLFGALIGIGAMLAALSAAVAAVCFWSPLQAASTEEKVMGDLANLLLAFLMLWAYFSFAHFLIMWSGDLPFEAGFYVARNSGIWGWITPVLSLGGFVIPFVCLFSHDFKRSPQKIGALALFLLFIRIVELWWMVLPTNGDTSHSGWHWSMVPAVITVAGIYGWALSRMMQRPKQCQTQEAAP